MKEIIAIINDAKLVGLYFKAKQIQYSSLKFMETTRLVFDMKSQPNFYFESKHKTGKEHFLPYYGFYSVDSRKIITSDSSSS